MRETASAFNREIKKKIMLMNTRADRLLDGWVGDLMCESENFFKMYLYIVASQRHICRATVNVLSGCVAGTSFPLTDGIPSSPTTQHPTNCFSLPMLIGEEAVHIKSRAIHWNWSELVDHIKMKSRFLNWHITRNTCIGYKNFADNKDFKT
jgi:hypothetical protein